MKKLFSSIILFVAMAATAQPSAVNNMAELRALTFVTTYYISPSGNDANNGSVSAPWKTLKKATTAVTTPGDIIHVNAGTYSETQNCSLAKGVSIQGDGVATTIIKSSLAGQWSVFISLRSGQDTNGDQEISGVTFDGQYVSESNNKTWWAIEVRGRSNVSIHDCKIINFRDRGVVFDGNDVTDPVTDPGHYATGNKFYNNTVLNSAAGTGNYGGGLLNIGGQDGMEIYNNTMIQTQRVAFKNGWPLKYWDNGWLKGVKVHDNTLTKAPYVGSYPGENGDWDFAIELFNIFGLQIYNNTIQGSIDLNYNKMGSYPYCAWIHHNTINHATLNGNFESGIILEFRTEAALIENNTFNNVSSGVQFNTRTKSQNGGYPNPGGGTPAGGFSQLLNNVIRNNLFTNVYQGNGTGTAAGVTVISESGNDPQISGLEISHNTIIAKAGDAPWIGIDFTSLGGPANVDGVTIKNNLVTGFKSAWIQGSSPTHMTNVIIQNNLTWSNANGNLPSWPGGNPQNYTYTGNIQADPKLTASFTPGPGSPAINGGTDGRDIGWTGGGGNGGGGGNQPPVANAGIPQTITLPANSATLNGSASDDGTIASIAWVQIAGPGTATIANAAQLSTSVTGLLQGNYAFELTVTDNEGLSDKDTAIIQVNPPVQQNTAPVVNAGADETITIILSLKGSATDAQNNIATYKWTKVSGPSGAVITNPDVPVTTVTGVKPGTYVYRLTVTDALGLKSNDTVTFTIK